MCAIYLKDCADNYSSFQWTFLVDTDLNLGRTLARRLFFMGDNWPEKITMVDRQDYRIFRIVSSFVSIVFISQERIFRIVSLFAFIALIFLKSFRHFTTKENHNPVNP
jgi:hypothetical protein